MAQHHNKDENNASVMLDAIMRAQARFIVDSQFNDTFDELLELKGQAQLIEWACRPYKLSG